jgi:hypothetical protein
LELEFNSLDAQRDACEAYIKSRASQGWRALPRHYDDPAYSGGNLDRPALQQLLKDIDAGRIDVIVVYKIDRLTRSLADFAKLVEAFDAKAISFGHPKVQHHHLDGPVDAERPAVICPVRARVVLRTCPRQGRGPRCAIHSRLPLTRRLRPAHVDRLATAKSRVRSLHSCVAVWIKGGRSPNKRFDSCLNPFTQHPHPGGFAPLNHPRRVRSAAIGNSKVALPGAPSMNIIASMVRNASFICSKRGSSRSIASEKEIPHSCGMPSQ